MFTPYDNSTIERDSFPTTTQMTQSITKSKSKTKQQQQQEEEENNKKMSSNPARTKMIMKYENDTSSTCTPPPIALTSSFEIPCVDDDVQEQMLVSTAQSYIQNTRSSTSARNSNSMFVSAHEMETKDKSATSGHGQQARNQAIVPVRLAASATHSMFVSDEDMQSTKEAKDSTTPLKQDPILVGTSTSRTRRNSRASNEVLTSTSTPTPTPTPSTKRDGSMSSNGRKNWITCIIVSILVIAACIAIGIIVSRDNSESIVVEPESFTQAPSSFPTMAATRTRFQPTNDDEAMSLIIKEDEEVIGEIKGLSAPNNPLIIDAEVLERALTSATEIVLGVVGTVRRQLQAADDTKDCVVTSTAISVGFEGCMYRFTTDQLKGNTNEDCYTYTIAIWNQQQAGSGSGCNVTTALREVQTAIVSSESVYEKGIGAIMVVEEEEEEDPSSTSMTTPAPTPPTVPTISPTSSTEQPSPTPTGAPTLLYVKPNPVPKNPRPDYFNYDLEDTNYGPGLQQKNGSEKALAWSKVDTSQHWLREFTAASGFGPYQGHLERKTPLKNRCNGPLYRQSPKDLGGNPESMDENEGYAPCLSGHEIRTKCGTKGINDKDYAKAEIFPHKLSLTLKRRQCVDDDTEDDDECDLDRPPLVDFPKYTGAVSSYSDLLNIDIKVKGEHRIEGEAFDAELQLFHTHYFKDRIGAIAIPVRAIQPGDYKSSSSSDIDKEFKQNVEFQKLLNVFQRVYNDHEEQCNEKRRTLTNLRQQQLPNKNKNNNTPIHDDEASRDFIFHNATTTAGSATTTATTTTTIRDLQKSKDKDPPQETRFDPYSDAFMPGIDFYRYDGSFTEPPCMYITWWVMAEPMLISYDQLNQLQTILFTHVDPTQECQPTSVHNKQQSVARPIFPNKGDQNDGHDSDDHENDTHNDHDDDMKGFIEKCVGNFKSDEKKGRTPGKVCTLRT